MWVRADKKSLAIDKIIFRTSYRALFQKKNIDEVVHKHGLPLTVHKN